MITIAPRGVLAAFKVDSGPQASYGRIRNQSEGSPKLEKPIKSCIRQTKLDAKDVRSPPTGDTSASLQTTMLGPVGAARADPLGPTKAIDSSRTMRK